MAVSRRLRNSLTGTIAALGGVPTAPANTVSPSITGTPVVGGTLTGANGTWTGRAAPVLTRQWRADGVAIPGATGATYVPVAGDAGKVITLAVTGRNWSGTVTAVSAATVAVAAA